MYEYERLRGITYQMDFSLPEGSPLLLCRMRVTNLQNKTIPMYWWSNIAVPETPDRRIVVPTDESYYSFLEHSGKNPPYPDAGGQGRHLSGQHRVLNGLLLPHSGGEPEIHRLSGQGRLWAGPDLHPPPERPASCLYGDKARADIPGSGS